MKQKVITIILAIFIFAMGIFFAKPAIAVTQGDVACTLVWYLNLDTSTCDAANKSKSVISTNECCIAALKGVGINLEGGWNAGAMADAAFMGKLYTAVNKATASGSLQTQPNLTTSSALTAAALTTAGLDPATILASIVAAGGNEAEAQKGIDIAQAMAAGAQSDGQRKSSVIFPDASTPYNIGGGAGSATQSR